jgi:hypothetical protein
MFDPVELARYVNSTAPASAFEGDAASGSPAARRYWGVPFTVLTEGSIVAGDQGGPVAIALDQAVRNSARASSRPAAPTYLVVLHECPPPVLDGSEVEAAGDPLLSVIPPDSTQLGKHVADYILEYADGSEHCVPVRWRFEIGWAGGALGQRLFAARGLTGAKPLDFRGPYPRNAWGRWQTGVGGEGGGTMSVYALPNPFPERPLRALRIEPSPGAEVTIAALTLAYGDAHPLRHERLQSFRVTLPPELVRVPGPAAPGSSGLAGDRPAPTTSDLSHVSMDVDLGVLVRTYALPAFDIDSWMGGSGISAPLHPAPDSVGPAPLTQVVTDVAASLDATLKVGEHAVPLRPAYEGGEARSADGAVRVEILTPHKTWLHVTVEDSALAAPGGPGAIRNVDGVPEGSQNGAVGTGKTVPSRIHFRAPDGRYLPPYGHRQEVNENWFEDYGADLKLHETQYAYVDGTFQLELPVGDVYVELFKGFEYQPLRQKLTIEPGQRELILRPERALDWRSRGWVTADTHVHFISPQVAWLQGRAEGLNLINLLASQWGDLHTNVGDISGGLSGVSRDETLVWVGTENRQHLLGHMSLLGIKGEPVFPMTTAGPGESAIGDPTWTTLAEWSDEARRKDGVVVIPHFPSPYAEVAADIVLEKIDAVEINMQQWPIRVSEWYRYLNCGYRVAAVGGTDKMSAQMPVGAIRTYARLEPDQPFSFEAWGDAVKAGHTFTTTGPLIDLTVEGKRPGDDLQLPSGGGTLHVSALAESVVPFGAVQILVNDRVVAERRSDSGMYRCQLEEAIQVPGSAWVAARIMSNMIGWIGSPRPVAAHTTPVYVVAGGAELFSPSDATYLLTVIEGGVTWMDTIATRPDPERHARNRKVFEDARDRLHARLHSHGQTHTHAASHGHTHN